MRNVLVTGASRGLGLAITAGLAEAGFRVLAAARTAGGLPALQLRLGADRVAFEPVDLAAVDALAGWVKGLTRRHGRLYGLVNNAAVAEAGMLALASEARLRRLLEMNVLSPTVLTKHAVRAMMAGADGGRIVNISSVVAATGYPGLAAYSASKAALVGFTRALARELGPLGITVNAVAPGFVATAMTDALDAADRAKIARRSALGRAPEPADVASAVTFLFGEGARNVTGTVLTVDAGNTA